MSAKFTIHQQQFIQNVHHVVKKNPVMAVVKNNAYNVGLNFAVQAFLSCQITHFATTSLEEAIAIRHIAPNAIIFLMNPTTEFEKLKTHHIHMTLPSLSFYIENQEALKGIQVHLEYENLLNRSGFKNIQEFQSFIELYQQDQHPNKMKVVGAWTHFGYADEFDIAEYDIEKQDWQTVLSFLSEHFTLQMVHAQNSASYFRENGLLNKHTHLRLGIVLYGARPYAALSESITQQAIEVSSEVIQIRTLYPNESAGYSFAYKSTGYEKLAVIAIGYGDGILRNRAKFDCLIHNKRYPIKALMMSHMFVLVDDLVKPGDKVVLYSNDIRIDEFTFKGVGANSEQLSALNHSSMMMEVIE